jgi:hypothetical protein
MKTKESFHDPGFQVRFPAASEDAGIYGRGGVNACIGDWR